VHRGNVLAAAATAAPPTVWFDTSEDPDDLYTLMMVSPDGIDGADDEVFVHWMVSDVATGDAAGSGAAGHSYLPASPAKSTGFHRYVFALFKQERKQHGGPDTNGGAAAGDTGRMVSVPALMEKNGLSLAGLAFFQSTWDESVQHS
jgi:large subunit ribosomal protein L38